MSLLVGFLVQEDLRRGGCDGSGSPCIVSSVLSGIDWNTVTKKAAVAN